MGNGESSGGGGGGGGGGYSYSTPGDHHSSSTAWSQPNNYSVSSTPSYHSTSYGGSIGPTVTSTNVCPTSINHAKCNAAQAEANSLCDRAGSNEGLGRLTPAGDISDGIKCLQAQAAADQACGK